MFLNSTERRIRLAAEQSLFYFTSGILGTEPGFDMLSPSLHLDMCNFLQSLDCTAMNGQIGTKRKLLLVPRDHFKTTLEKSMILHMLIQPEHNNIYFPGKKGTDTLILFGGDSLENVRKHIGVVKGVIENHKLFRHFWPHVEPGPHWTQDSFNVKRNVNFSESTCEAVSIGSPVASRHVDAFFKDDIFTFKAMIEAPTAARTIMWHQSTISVFRQNQHCFEIVCGTPWAQNDVYNFIMNNEPYFALYHRAAIENGKPIFPERYTMEDLLNIKRRLEGSGLWELNYMCDHSGGILSDFKRHWFKTFTFDAEKSLIHFEKEQEVKSPLAMAVQSAMEGEPFDTELIEKTLSVSFGRD